MEQIEAKVNNKDSRFTVKEEDGKEVDCWCLLHHHHHPNEHNQDYHHDN
ncbi:MAG: hypothetical protein M3288_01880 [Thermoproteota archaeon]|nr:hypothetical protein [Thermoproteota archaeon]